MGIAPHGVGMLKSIGCIGRNLAGFAGGVKWIGFCGDERITY